MKMYVHAVNRFNEFKQGKDEGASMVEYGLLVGLIAVASIGVLGFLGDDIANFFQNVRDALAGAG